MFETAGEELDRIEEIAWKAYSRSRKAPVTRAGGRWIRRSRLSVVGRVARDAREAAGAGGETARSGHTVTDPADHRLRPQRRLVPGRDLEDVPPRRFGAGGDRRRRHRIRRSRPEPAHFRLRPPHFSLQRLRVDRDAVVPLAVQLLPQPCARPGRRLDGRDLPALGRGARGDHPDAGVLVPDARRAQAHDRSPRMRGWRQPRSHLDFREECREGQGAGAGRLALSAASRGTRVRRGGARGRRRASSRFGARYPTG